MTAAHERINTATPEEAAATLLRCCASTRWVERVLTRRPFASFEELQAVAKEAWLGLDRADYLEAFAQHPRLGADPTRLHERFATADWSTREQAGVRSADVATLEALRAGNAAYEERFGFVFLVCATGKGAREVLTLLEQRIGNDPEAELGVAAAEQAKITELRLERLAP